MSHPITVAELAEELDIPTSALGNYAPLHSTDPDANIPADLADRIRAGVAADRAVLTEGVSAAEPIPASTPGDDPMVARMRAEQAAAEDELAEARRVVTELHGPGAAISHDLAAELGITLVRFAEILGLDPAMVSGREFLTGETAEAVRAKVRKAEGIEDATGLTLETYAPGPIALAALAYAVKGIRTAQTPREALSLMAPIMAITSGVVLADLVEQGVAPYAETPGVQAAEIGDDEYGALVEWVGSHMAQSAFTELMSTFIERSSRPSRSRQAGLIVIDVGDLRRHMN